MRGVELEPIRAALAAHSARAAREAERFKRISAWRERLIAEGATAWRSWRAGARISIERSGPGVSSAAQAERRARRRRRRGGQRAVSRAARIVRYNAVMKPLVGIIMGSSSDWETMQSAAELLDKLAVPYECASSRRTVRPTCCSNTPQAAAAAAWKC